MNIFQQIKTCITKFVLLVVCCMQANCTVKYSWISRNHSQPKSLKLKNKLAIHFVREPEYYNKRFNNIEYTWAMYKEKYFVIDKHADTVVLYKTESEKSDASIFNRALWLLTLGMVPLNEPRQSKVTFAAYSRSQKRTIATYTYKVNESNWFGWLSIPTSLVIFPVFGQTKKLFTGEGFDTEGRLMAYFAEDFYSNYQEEIPSNEPNQNNLFLIIPSLAKGNKYPQESKMLSSKLETAMDEAKFKIKYSKDLTESLKQNAFFQTSVSKKAALVIARSSGANKFITSAVIYYKEKEDKTLASVAIYIIDANTAKVEWRNMYSLKAKNKNEIFAKIAKMLLQDLKAAGY
ncbi:MAG: hypothetical protein AAF518_14075 [Spirochaetota bacterium]